MPDELGSLDLEEETKKLAAELSLATRAERVWLVLPPSHIVPGKKISRAGPASSTRNESAGGNASGGSQPFAIIARPMKCICAFT